MMTSDSILITETQYNDIQKVKEIISNYQKQSLVTIKDVKNPLFGFSHYLQITADTLDTIQVMLQVKPLKIN